MTDDDSFDLNLGLNLDSDVDGSNNDSGVTTDSSSTVYSNEDGDSSYGRRSNVYKDRSDVVQRSSTSRSDSTDEVNPRRLVREPTLSDIRWFYRNTFGKVLVDKPIDDAFKNWFEIKNDPSDSIKDVLEDYIPDLKLAEKKARRDGMSVLFKKFREDSEMEPHDAPTRDSVSEYLGADILTVDDLRNVSESQIESQVPDGYGRQNGGHYNYTCRKSGLVLSEKVSDIHWQDPIGVVVDQERIDPDPLSNETTYQFVHKDRLQFFTWNEEVDGDFRRDDNNLYGNLRRDQTTIGEWEGDSELQPVYHLLKDLFKGNWAIMQTVFRYSSPFYQVTVPARDAQTEEDFEKARSMFDNLNAKAEGVFPEGYELEMHDIQGNFDPTGYFDPIFDQICAGTEMTRSVLFGTQSGTVSGSETDVKSYFNQVTRYQNGRAEEKIEEHVRSIGLLDNSAVPNFALGYQIHWNPLFELDQLDKAENARTVINGLVQAANQYSLTPNELRSLISEILDDLDYELDLSDDLDIEDFDFMVDVELASNGNNRPMSLEAAQEVMMNQISGQSQSQSQSQSGSSSQETENQGNPRVGNNVKGKPPAKGTSGEQSTS